MVLPKGSLINGAYFGQYGPIHICIVRKRRPNQNAVAADDFVSHMDSTSGPKRKSHELAQSGICHGAIDCFWQRIFRSGSRESVRDLCITPRAPRYQTSTINSRSGARLYLPSEVPCSAVRTAGVFRYSGAQAYSIGVSLSNRWQTLMCRTRSSLY